MVCRRSGIAILRSLLESEHLEEGEKDFLAEMVLEVDYQFHKMEQAGEDMLPVEPVAMAATGDDGMKVGGHAEL